LKTLIEFTEHAYERLLVVVEGIAEKELHWRPIPEMNSAYKIFRHSARISFILLPQVVEGTTTGDWDDDYERHERSLQGMLRDLETGRVRVLGGLRSLEASDLDEMIPLWDKKHRRAEGVNMLVGELVYHAGQIALLRGAYRRAH